MDLALTINGWIDEEVIFAQQLGARQVFASLDVRQVAGPGGNSQPLAWLANRITKAGLGLAGLYVTGGRPGTAETTLAQTAALVKAAGAAGIGLFSLSTTMFPARRSTRQPIADGWAPLAEAAAQAGVRLSIPAALLVPAPTGGKALPGGQPADILQNLPPGASAGMDAAPELLLGWLQNAKVGPVLAKGVLDKLFLISFENRRPPVENSTGDAFDELLAVCYRLKQAGYPGLIRLGQPPHWKGDSRQGHRASAYSAGFLRAVLQAFQGIGPRPKP